MQGPCQESNCKYYTACSVNLCVHGRFIHSDMDKSCPAIQYRGSKINDIAITCIEKTGVIVNTCVNDEKFAWKTAFKAMRQNFPPRIGYINIFNIFFYLFSFLNKPVDIYRILDQYGFYKACCKIPRYNFSSLTKLFC